ncbi:MAG: hypothetical protein OIF36_04530 [Alphaproteobacteria bacterium]|nr:hypothetical protein [Alphaproteobacteria bacterium]
MSGQKEHGPLFTILLTSMVIAIFGWGMWYVYKYDIMNVLRWITYAQLYVIDVFVNNDVIVRAKTALLSAEKSSLDLNDLIKPTMFLAGYYMRYVFTPFMLYMAYKVIMVPSKKLLRKKMDLNGMIRYQAEAWPYIKPFIDYDPGKESSRAQGDPVPRKLKVFAEALSPEDWIVYNDISVDSDSYEFDELKAKKEFQKQLGERWRGSAKLPEYQRALLAAFALKGARKREAADAFLGDLCSLWTREKGFEMTKDIKARVSKILSDPKVGHEAVKIANNNAYVNSAMLNVLEWARKRGGVLAPAQFLWLKGVDRDLWYALNSLGRRTYFSEGSGAIAHYYAEKSLGKPLVTINVDKAIESIKDYFDEHYPNIPVKEQGEENENS